MAVDLKMEGERPRMTWIYTLKEGFLIVLDGEHLVCTASYFFCYNSGYLILLNLLKKHGMRGMFTLFTLRTLSSFSWYKKVIVYCLNNRVTVDGEKSVYKQEPVWKSCPKELGLLHKTTLWVET